MHLLVVGDVHGMWDDVDRRYVEAGEQDLVVFVGDIGDEDVELVKRLAGLRCAKAVILGNHDAWNGMRRDGDLGAVEAQLESLGEDHIAYRAVRLRSGEAAVVGARPFSWGGGWKSWRRFYEPLYGVSTNDDSARRMVEAARSIPELPLIVVGHNGPKGLGTGEDAIFGCDFRRPHIDFGDPDFELALARLRDDGRRVVATIAGHMHHRVRGGGLRRRVVAGAGTVHVNAAVVPRHVRWAEGRLRHFTRVDLEGAELVSARDLWIDDAGVVASSAPLYDASNPATDRRPELPHGRAISQ